MPKKLYYSWPQLHKYYAAACHKWNAKQECRLNLFGALLLDNVEIGNAVKITRTKTLSDLACPASLYPICVGHVASYIRPGSRLFIMLYCGTF